MMTKAFELDASILINPQRMVDRQLAVRVIETGKEDRFFLTHTGENAICMDIRQSRNTLTGKPFSIERTGPFVPPHPAA